jgi:hypothetical protein
MSEESKRMLTTCKEGRTTKTEDLIDREHREGQ